MKKFVAAALAATVLAGAAVPALADDPIQVGILSCDVDGGVGYLMVMGGWPRAPFVLGLVLGKIAENYLYISVARYEAAWLTRPIVLVLFALAVAVILYPLMQARRSRAKESAHA